MMLGGKQDLIIMLTVDGNELHADLTQCGNGGRSAVDSADGAAVRTDFARQRHLPFIAGYSHFGQQLHHLIGKIGEECGHSGPLTSGTHPVTGNSLSEHGLNAVDQDGFTGTGFAGEHMKGTAETDAGLFDHGEIFNV